jgi:hypothetical protein
MSFHVGDAPSAQEAVWVVSTSVPLSVLPSLCGSMTCRVKGSKLSSALSFPATVYLGFHAGTVSLPPLPLWGVPSPGLFYIPSL